MIYYLDLLFLEFILTLLLFHEDDPLNNRSPNHARNLKKRFKVFFTTRIVHIWLTVVGDHSSNSENSSFPKIMSSSSTDLFSNCSIGGEKATLVSKADQDLLIFSTDKESNEHISDRSARSVLDGEALWCKLNTRNYVIGHVTGSGIREVSKGKNTILREIFG